FNFADRIKLNLKSIKAMFKGLFFVWAIVFLMFQPELRAQQISKEELIFLTPEWKGERFEDGRPRVPDALLARLKYVTHEEAWAFLRSKGYAYQYAEGNWEYINPDSVLVGRAVTATFMPGRPDVWKAIDERGKKEGRKAQNVWAVELLVK